MNMKKREHKLPLRRLLATLLTLVMLLAVLPVNAMAGHGGGGGGGFPGGGGGFPGGGGGGQVTSKITVDHLDLGMQVDGSTVKIDEAPKYVTIYTADENSMQVAYSNEISKGADGVSQWRYNFPSTWSGYYISDNDTDFSSKRIVGFAVTYKASGVEYNYSTREYSVLAAGVKNCPGKGGLDNNIVGTEAAPTYYYKVIYRLYDDEALTNRVAQTGDKTVESVTSSSVDLTSKIFSSYPGESETYRVQVLNGTTPITNYTVDLTSSKNDQAKPVEIYVDYLKQQEEVNPMVSFFVRLDGTIVDNASGARSWPSNLYSSELQESVIVDSGNPQMSDNASTWVYEGNNVPNGGDVNEYIESMASEGGTYYVESFLGSPADVNALKAYLEENPSETLEINGQDITEDFKENTSKYDIYWYVLKNHHKADAENWDLGGGERYHLDGVVVLKPENVETLTITKTFNAATSADLDVVTASDAFCLDITDANGAVVSGLTTEGVLVSGKYLTSYGYLVSVDSDDNTVSKGVSRTYTWTLKLPKNVTYTVTEDYNGALSAYTVAVANDGDLDETVTLNSVQAVAFTNTYAKRAPGVSITKSADKSAYQVGDTVTYTIKVANASTATKAAEDVVVTDELPEELTFASAVVTVGDLELNSDESTKTDPITWKVGKLEAGDEATLTIEATINNDVLNNDDGTKKTSATISNTAYVNYTGNGDPIPSDPVDVTVTEKTYNYQVKYEYMLQTNGVGSYTSQGTSSAVTRQAAAEPSDEDVFAIALEAIEDSNVSLTYTSQAGEYTYAKHHPMQPGDVSKNDAAFASGNRVYTVKVYYEHWTVGTLTIKKAVYGDLDTNSADLNGITFSVYKGDEAEPCAVINYADAISGKSIQLEQGTYTIVENDADVTGYTRLTSMSGNGTNVKNGFKVDVVNGESKNVNITNTYTGKMYRIIFDADSVGKMCYGSNGLVKGGECFSYFWTEFVENEESKGYDWGGGLHEVSGSDHSLVGYRFSQGQRNDVSFDAPQAKGNTGYEWTGTFTLLDKNGDKTEETGADLQTIMDALDDPDYYFMTSETIDGEEGVTVYNVRLLAKYDYDLTYTFNDFGSQNVTMTYWTVGDEALSSVTKFGTSSGPKEVTAQTNLTKPSDFKQVIFFVKANDGYQINSQILVKESETALGAVSNPGVGQIFEVSGTAPEFVDDKIWEEAKEDGYTQYFQYTVNGFNDTTFEHPEYLNRYFKVVATKNPVYAISGTKTVVQGQNGNQAPGSKEFSFLLLNEQGETVDKAKTTVTGFGSAEFNFGSIEYKQAGTYTYTVKEEAAESTYWTYDTTEYEVEIVVDKDDNDTDDDTSDDFLKITSVTFKTIDPENGEGEEVNGLTFTNTYTRYVAPTRPGTDDPTPIVLPGGPSIPDEDVPLADLPDEDVPLTDQPDDEEEFEELPEEEVPLAEAPETGDTSALWLTVTALSGTSAAGLMVLGRKKREDEE